MEDLRELDHRVPLSQGGTGHYSNWQIIHRHCHDQKTAQDGSLDRRGSHDKGQSVEEPDELNGSRPVLKAGRLGDQSA
jgi:RNA-directed DNA polymerase